MRQETSHSKRYGDQHEQFDEMAIEGRMLEDFDVMREMEKHDGIIRKPFDPRQSNSSLATAPYDASSEMESSDRKLPGFNRPGACVGNDLMPAGNVTRGGKPTNPTVNANTGVQIARLNFPEPENIVMRECDEAVCINHLDVSDPRRK